MRIKEKKRMTNLFELWDNDLKDMSTKIEFTSFIIEVLPYKLPRGSSTINTDDTSTSQQH